MPSVFITGANRGIGLGFAQEYLKKGCQVFAACRQPETATALKKELETCADRLTILPLDFSNPDAINTAFQLVKNKISALDVLINNAGVLYPSESVETLNAEALRQSFEVNTIAPVLVAQAFVSLLNSNAKLVNITMPTPPISKWTRTNNHAYVSSRYAFNALTKMIALEFEAKGIITVALYPGYLQTDMNQYNAEAKPVSEGIPLAVAVIDSLTKDHNGKCLLPNGQLYDW